MRRRLRHLLILLACAVAPRVRLLLIDAPELSQGPFGDVARAALDLIEVRSVRGY